MNINTNISSLNTQFTLNHANKSLNTAMTELSSGKRINSAKDDAAGLAISSLMSSRISGMDVAKKNTSDGIAMLSVAEGGLSSISSLLTRMRDLTIQASNGVYSNSDRSNLHVEFDNLKNEINKISQKTNFNNINLLNGGNTIVFQTGSNAGETFPVSISSITTTDLNIENLKISSDSEALSSLPLIDKAIDMVSKERSTIGSYINRLEFTINNLTTSRINLSASRSRIEDTDMAKSATELAKQNVIVQFSTAMLSQANINPQNALKLI